MRGPRIRRRAFALACVWLAAGAALAASRGFDVQVDRESSEGLSLTIAVRDVSVEHQVTPAGTWTVARVPGLANPVRFGQPVLPEWTGLFVLPDGVRPVLRVDEIVERPLAAAMAPAWVERDLGDGTTRIRPVVSTDAVDPAVVAPVRVETVGELRGLRLGRIVVRPVGWNEDAGWRVTRDLRVTVDFEADPESRSRTGHLTLDRMNSRFAAEVLNPGTLATISDADAPAIGMDRSEFGVSPAASTSAIPSPEPSIMTPLRVLVREDGMVEVTHADLIAGGADPTGIDPSTFVLTLRDQEVPIDVTGVIDGSFDPGDVIRFYGQNPRSEEFWDHVYRLTGGVRAGLRMTTRDVTPDAGAAVPADYTDTIDREFDSLYWASLPSDVTSAWYWTRVRPPAAGGPTFVEETFDLSNVAPDQGHTARVEVRIQSRRETPGPSPNHHVTVRLNGNLVDDQYWTGLQTVTMAADVPQAWIQEGANVVRIEKPLDLGLTSEEEWIDWIRLGYRDRFVAEADVLTFAVESTDARFVTVEGFTAGDVIGYDLADPSAPVVLTGLSITDVGGSYNVELSNAPGTPAGPFLLMRPGAGRSAYAIEPSPETDLRDHALTGADLLIVAHDGFLPALQPLVDHRESQGLRVVAAALSDVYEEFNGGIAEPLGIRNFVQWAYENYASPAPAFVLLVGDATYDPKDLKGEGDDYVPARFFHQNGFGLGPTDTWYGAVSGDDPLPDLAVGRIGARTVADVENHVSSLIAFEQTPPVVAINQGNLYVADDDDSAFEAILEGTAADWQPPAFATRRVYMRSYASGASAKSDIQSWIDDGVLVASYLGHGTRTRWAAEGMWNEGDVASLAPTGHLPFVLALNCVNGYFTNLDAEPYGLGESWTRSLDRGALGNWSPSATGTLFNYEVMIDRFFEKLFVERETRAGAAAWQALLTAHLTDNVPINYVQQMVYFGDPAALVPLDSDHDQLLDDDELAAGSDPDDADGDDDGLTDDLEPSWDADPDADGRVNAADPDSDDDGLPDGLEHGLTSPSPSTDTTAGWFVADVDPASTTAIQIADTDGGGAPDGAEDRNVNGAVDAEETDPNVGADDPVCPVSATTEIEQLLVNADGDDVVLSWAPQHLTDPCVLYRVYISVGAPTSADAFEYVATTTLETFRHRGARLSGTRFNYLVTATSPIPGEGPLGHFGE